MMKVNTTTATCTAGDTGTAGGTDSSTTISSSRQSILELATSSFLTTTTTTSPTTIAPPIVIDFDDGHVPENFATTTMTSTSGEPQQPQCESDCRSTKLVLYPSYHMVQHRTPTVHVLDNAIMQQQQQQQEHLVDALYRVTANVEDAKKPWGTYVTMEQIRDYHNSHNNTTTASSSMDTPPSTTTSSSAATIAKERESLAIAAAAHFMQNALQISSQSSSSSSTTTTTDKDTQKQELLNVKTYVPSSSSLYQTTTTTTMESTSAAAGNPPGDDSNSNTKQPPPLPLWTLQDQEQMAHGVAVWALASTEHSQVPYHLDYAEQIRYEYNVIVPPILAGTLQCSPIGGMKGGEFCVCFDGLSHYETHGYKGAKYDGDGREDPFDYTKDTAAEWVAVPYRHNRMIIASGHLPHLSTSIESMNHNTTTNDNNNNSNDNSIKRVILGFNVFGHDYGPLVQRAPEHSDAFRRKVKLQRVINQAAARARSCHHENDTNNMQQQQQQQQQRVVSLEAIHANKGLSKLLVLAKREKVKRELALAQEQLDRELDAFLLLEQQKQQAATEHNNNNNNNNNHGGGGVSVENLMTKFGRTDGQTWPSPVDVQVHIRRRLSYSSSLASSRSSSSTKENITANCTTTSTTQEPNKPNVRRNLRLWHPDDDEAGEDHASSSRMVLPSDIVYLD